MLQFEREQMIEFKKYLSQIKEYLGVTEDFIYRDISPAQQSFSASELLKIADNLQVDAVSLFRKQLDLEVLKSYSLNGSNIHIPKKYNFAKFSHIESFKNTLKMLDTLKIGDFVLKKLQIKREMISHQENVSIFLISDMLFSCGRHISTKDSQYFGKLNADIFWEKILKNVFPRKAKPHQLIELLIENSFLLERNWDYKVIKHSSNSLKFESTPSKTMKDFCQIPYYDNLLVNSGRVGFFMKMFKKYGYQAEIILKKKNRVNTIFEIDIMQPSDSDLNCE